jgi:hypothetical protein
VAAPCKNINGLRFGHLVVVERATNDRQRQARWKCRCDCGKVLTAVRGTQLRAGGTRSCGCLRRRPRTKAPVTEDGAHG